MPPHRNKCIKNKISDMHDSNASSLQENTTPPPVPYTVVKDRVRSPAGGIHL